MQKITFLRSSCDGKPKRSSSGTGADKPAPQSSRLCGFLQKEGPRSFNLGISGAKRRWFSLEGVDLVYYSQPGDTKSLGFIHIPDVQRVYKKTDKSFVLVTRKREWVLHAGTAERAKYWINGIKGERLRKVRMSSTPEVNTTSNLGRFKAPFPVLKNSNRKAVRFSPQVTPKLTKAKGALQTKMVEIEREEIRIKQLQEDKEQLENEEMKLLLKSLTVPQPFPVEDVKKQSLLEQQIMLLDEDISAAKNMVSNVNYGMKLGFNEKMAHSINQRRRRNIFV